MLVFGAGKPWDEAAEYDMTRGCWLADAAIVAVVLVGVIVVDGCAIVVGPALKAGEADGDTFGALLSKGDTLATGFFGSSVWLLIG